MPNLKDLPQQLLQQWRGLSRRAQIAALAATAAVLTLIVYASATSGRVDWAPLYAGLSPEDAGAIADKLRDAHVPTKITRGGEAIEVPRDRVPEVRLQLASAGLPRGGGVGFELFDKQSLGVSDFAQRVNYHRALQGELERSIATLAAVARARVHLVVPEKSLFKTADQQASASVALQLRPGQLLAPAQVQGIVHLIASSVEGLQPGRVTVIDQRGDVLSQKSGADAAAGAALGYQRELEQTAAGRAQQMLEKTLGRGHAAVQVTAQVDTAQIERTHEEFNPDQQVVRSEQEVDDVVGAGAEGTSGVAGARGNLPGGPPPQVNPEAGSRRHSQTRNYEISKVTRKVNQPVGKIERLTVAVLVDGTYAAPAPAGKDAEAQKTRKFTPRTKEELETYAAIVKEAVGFDARRGDQIEVRCVPFTPTAEEADMTEVREVVPVWAWGAAALAFLSLGAFVTQIIAARRREKEPQLIPAGLVLPSSVHQIEESLEAPPPPRPALASSDDVQREALLLSQKLREQALELLLAQPERAARVLSAWLSEPDAPAPSVDLGAPRPLPVPQVAPAPVPAPSLSLSHDSERRPS